MPFQDSSITPVGFQDKINTPYNWRYIAPAGRDVTSSVVTIQQIRDQVMVGTDTSFDSYLLALAATARMRIEEHLGRPLSSEIINVYYGSDVVGGDFTALDLPVKSLQPQSITNISVQYYNDSDALIDVPATQFFLDLGSQRVVLRNWSPALSNFIPAPIVVTYTAAPDILATYPTVKQAALLLITHWWNNRSDTGETVGEKASIPHGAYDLLSAYRSPIL